jgi:2-amino-4-hydroxy-6-hydroxymethyldihydropteridine diphosphokinase
MHTIYIGIGSNIGDREKNCIQALELMQKNNILIKKKSGMHETEPWGNVKDQPKFINMAIEADTDKAPEELLATLRNIEQLMGREHKTKWGPRVIDLDILLFDDLVLKKPDLEIPHPLMHKRDFVLAPLCEIAPDVIHPAIGKTIKGILNQL